MLERKLLEAEPGDPVHTLAQARTSTVILRLNAAHNESVTRFLINSGLALGRDLYAYHSEASARLLSRIALSHATLSDTYLLEADLSDSDLSGADLSDAFLSSAQGITNEELEQQADSLQGATMLNGQKYEDWLKSKDRKKDGKDE
jgi:uncharacterized protein YjbI with pentapeptide repeats